MGQLVDKSIIQAREICDAANQVTLVIEQLDKSFEREQATIETTFDQVKKP